MGRLPKRLKEIEDTKTFKDKIFEIIDDTYFDPYNGTKQIVQLVRKIIKVEIKALQKAMDQSRKAGHKNAVVQYGLQIWLLLWLLDEKFNIIKKDKK
ncbi:MAG TPA: hypothetical protein VFG90_04645 [Nitrososphaeraceae archaeon]|nr:hypothetical protein [Nitrososphaeraceae archaeon]